MKLSNSDMAEDEGAQLAQTLLLSTMFVHSCPISLRCSATTHISLRHWGPAGVSTSS